MPGKNKRGYKIRSAVRTIAGERIDILLSQAREMLDRDPKLSKRYVELARKISMRTKVRIPSSQKRNLGPRANLRVAGVGLWRSDIPHRLAGVACGRCPTNGSSMVLEP